MYFTSPNLERELKLLFNLLCFATLLLLIATVCSLLGIANRLCEIAEHFTLQYIIASVVLGLWAWLMGKKRMAALCGALFLLHTAEIGYVALRFSQPPLEKFIQAETTPFTLLQFNALYHNNDAAAVQLLETLTDHDILVFQEYPDSHLFEKSEKLTARYPYRHISKELDVFFKGVAVFSKHPFELEIAGPDGLPEYTKVLRLFFPQQQMIVYAVHSPTPLPLSIAKHRDMQQEWLMEKLANENLPAVALGDFNQTPYATGFQRKLNAHSIHLAPFPDNVLPSWPSMFLLPVFQVPIDLLLANRRAFIEGRKRVNIPGSDHVAISNRLLIQSP